VALLISSIVQAGVLWSENNESFTPPFVFVPAANPGPAVRSSRPQADLSGIASVVLNPWRVTVCDGGTYAQTAHFPITRNSELFSTLNARCRAFFAEAASIAPVTELPAEQWGGLVSSRGILAEFKADIPLEVVGWLTGRDNPPQNAPAGINKLLILPEDDAGVQGVYLYVLSNDRIYRILSASSNFFDISKLINDSLAELDADASVRYMTIGEVGGGRFPYFAPDVFCTVEGPKTSHFRRIRYASPVGVRDNSELENIILGSDIHSYNRSVDFDDALVFRNVTSVYRLYGNGLMEYSHLPLPQPADKGSVAAALENAAAYVLNIETRLLGSAELALSGVYDMESDSQYRFTFDYIIEGTPVYFWAGQAAVNAPDAGGGRQNAVSICANANRVLSCRWILVDLFFSSESKPFRIYFDSVDVGRNMTDMAVSDISAAYVVELAAGEDGGGEIFGGWPVWAITAPDGAVDMVRLSEG